MTRVLSVLTVTAGIIYVGRRWLFSVNWTNLISRRNGDRNVWAMTRQLKS